MTAYLDNSATTKPCEASVKAICAMLETNYGNPSSLHTAGIQAHRAVEQAREAVAAALGAEDKTEIIFTSGGTEANNLAVFGSAYALGRKGRRIITTAIEHESVLEPFAQLENEGFEVIRLKPDQAGHISVEQLKEAVNDNTILVSMMMVNNEVGTLLPVGEIRKILKQNGSPAYLHIDAVQAFGKMPVKVRALGADLVTVTAHKIHGPKGVGALYIKKGAPLRPRAFGGEQERKIRPGTEASPLIAGFGAAVKEADWKAAREQVSALNQQLRSGLAAMDGVLLNSPEDAVPYILNIAVAGIRSQTLIQFLSGKGVCVSNGSACGKGKKSHVLTAMGLSPERIDSSIRVSFSRYNTPGDVDAFLLALNEAMGSLARR